MPGEQLMCVWSAAYARNPFSPDKQLTKEALNDIVLLLADLPCFQFSQDKFNTHFKTNDDINIASFKRYLTEVLAERGTTPQFMLEEEVKNKCWEISKSALISKHLTDTVTKKLWEIFNRLTEVNSYPPKISPGVTEWFVEKVSNHLGKNWKNKPTHHSACYTFSTLLERLTGDFFTDETQASVSSCVDELHSWLVLEVMKSGWLYKRTRKQANWTNWIKRWFVLSSTRLCYYENSNVKNDKKLRGEVFLVGSKLESLPSYKGLIHKLQGRFRVSNLPYQEMEMSTEEKSQKRSWMNSIEEVIDALKNKTTPIQRLLKERWGEDLSSRLEETELKNADALPVIHPETVFPLKAVPDQKTKVHTFSVSSSSVSSQEESFDNAEDNNLTKESTEKIKGVFMQIDKDGNGKIDNKEFLQFISGLGLTLKPREINMLYNSIKKDNTSYITFQEFSDYFANVLLDESVDGEAETKLRCAFLRADRDGTGTLNFKEYAEYIWDRKRSIRMSKLITAFDNMDQDKDGHVSYDQFRNFYKNRLCSIDESSDHSQNEVDGGLNVIDFKLKEFYNKTEANDLARFIRDRWNKFATFKRYGASGELAMKGAHGMVDDVVPGEYSLLELACFSDLPPLVPKYTAVKGIKWQPSRSKGRSGKLIFPKGFDGVLVKDTATSEHLRYYGCSFAEGNQLKISLLYRHGIQDFTYENQYLDDYVTKSNGGAGLEKHEFSHLDCPLEEDSGTFILAKVVGNDELHITAFSIPVRHTLYIPGGVIHSNDYLKGTWRTMLSDEADIDHVHLVRDTGDKRLEQFKFQFFG